MLKKIVLGVISLAIILPASMSLAGPGGQGTRGGGFGGQSSQQNDHSITHTDQLRMDFTEPDDHSGIGSNPLNIDKGLREFGTTHPKSPDLQNNPGFQHGMSQATTHGQGKKLGLGRGLEKGRGHRR
jgi:hypothetical protein